MPEPTAEQRPAGTAQLVLGTVQLGLAYGRRRHDPPLSQADAFAILDQAWAVGIRAFDTAAGYGASPARLAAWLDERGHWSDANVVTKVKPTNDRIDVAAVIAAVEPFRRCKSLVFLTHGFLSASPWASLTEVRELGAVHLGQSVYDPWEIKALLRLPKVARAQAPGSIIDNRALGARGQDAMPLDLRSAFLQGLLLESAAGAEARVRGAGSIVEAVDRAARRFGRYSRPALLVRALLCRLAAADRIVVGVDAPSELDQILEGFSVPEDIGRSFAADVTASLPAPLTPSLIDPRKWT